MCTVNMSFEVPDARRIDIEALLFDRLLAARNEIQNGFCVKCSNPEELNAFLDSL